MALKTWQIILIALGALVGLFLVASIVIGVIVYFGMFSPSKTLPEQCILADAGLNCLDHRVTPGEVVLVLGNNFGRDILLGEIIVTESIGPESTSRHTCTFDSSTGAAGLPLANGEIVTLTSDTCHTSDVKKGERYRYEIGIFYHIKDDNLNRVVTGEIYTSVK